MKGGEARAGIRDTTMSDSTRQSGKRGTRATGREGVALIIVMGLLALIVLMAVSFSIYMRTGRVAAGNFRNDVRARQLLHVALNRAFQDIDSNLSSNLYPSWYYLESDGGTEITGVTNPPAMDWIPLAAMGTNLNPKPKWIEEWYGGGKMEGRVGYLVVNCSGLLDANYAGAKSRGIGTNASEIQIGELPEVAAANSIDTDRPYETLQELGSFGVQRGTFSSTPGHFVTYSLFPTNDAVDVGGNVADLLAKRTQIIAGFTNSGFTLAQAGCLFTNLVDYVDGDVEPGNLGVSGAGVMEGPYVEPTPLFNEVFVTNEITLTPNGTNYTMTVGRTTLRFECFYPFIAGTNRTGYTFNYRVVMTNSSFWAAYPSNAIAGSFPLDVPVAPAEYWTRVTLPARMIGVGQAFNDPGASISISAVISAWITKSGVTVDATTNPPITIAVSMPKTVVGGNLIYNGSGDRECRDPRLNWDGVNHWRASLSNNTIGAVNTRTLEELGKMGLPPPGWQARDGDTAMHVANARLQVPGELGYLYYNVGGNQRFETVRLYKHGPNPLQGNVHPVLDNFVVRTTADPTKGLVNVNTRDSEVWRTLYADMPIDKPSGTGSKTVDATLLDTVVNTITASRNTGEFSGLSDLGRIDWATVYASGNDLDKEAFVRNVSGLLGTRQNLFAILLFAQTTKTVPQMPDKSVVSGVRAVAEVWRDPTTSLGQPAYFLRTFKILNE